MAATAPRFPSILNTVSGFAPLYSQPVPDTTIPGRGAPSSRTGPARRRASRTDGVTMPRIAAAEKAGSRRSLTDLAYDHLRSAILHGELPVGTILAEATIAERLGISKTPVRQALQLLRTEGLLTS